jgi:hypothetical protein
MGSHAACSPSSAAMWLACPASVTMTKDVVRPSSKYAREGTAAHAVAEMNLKGDIFLPDKVYVEGEEFIVSPGMCRALNPYVTYVETLRALPKASVFLEHRIVVPQSYNMVWGTLDCGVYADRLYVADLKFGKGHVVAPDAPQLKLYALGLARLASAEDPRLQVRLTVCQPRVPSVEPLRSHDTTLGELWQWQDFEVTPALGRIAAGDTSENAGPHCRWCVRKTECRAFASQHQTHAATAFDDGA